MNGAVVGGVGLAIAAAFAASSGIAPERPVATAAEPVAVASLMPHALNALLVPLLDDGVPPRWVDPALPMNCAADPIVTVDGAPLAQGAEVPARAFSMALSLTDCRPFSITESFDGDASLTVFPEDGGGYTAIVDARRLRVLTSRGEEHWRRPFAARVE